MSQESIAHDPEAFFRALGADSAIYVGRISTAELLANGGLPRIEAAKRARDIAAKPFEEKTALEGTLSKLIGLIDPGSEAAEDLDDTQKDGIANQVHTVLGIIDRAQAGEPPERTIRSLFDAYFETQGLLQDSSANHYLRVAGDDYAIEVGYDFDAAWGIYQDALAVAERRPFVQYKKSNGGV